MGMDWLIIEFFDTLCGNMRVTLTLWKGEKLQKARNKLCILSIAKATHGDIKPSNLIVTLSHEVKLIDLGSIVPIGADYREA